MTRNKVKLAYIANDSARKTTFKKRKVGVVKKLHELTTLCGIEACSIIYSAFDPQPLIWPSVDEARKLIMKFKSFSEVDQVKRKVNQESFTRQRIQKMEEKLRKLQRENRHKEMTQIMFQAIMDPQTAMLMLNMGDYEELIRVTNQNLMEVDRMMEMRRRDSSFTHPPPPPPPHLEGVAGDNGGGGGGQQLVFMSQNHGNNGGDGSQHVIFGHHEFMPQNHGVRFQPPSSGGAGNGGLNHHRFQWSNPNGNSTTGVQPVVLSHEFMPTNHGRFPLSSSLSSGFSMAPNMTYPPPVMAVPPPNMGFPDYQINDMNYMGLPPYPPNNQPSFPYYHNPDMGPHDPSLH